jgi:hypothetical protein
LNINPALQAIVKAEETKKSSPKVTAARSQSSVTRKSRRKRSALRDDLVFCGLYTDAETEQNCKYRRPASYEIPEEEAEDEDEDDEVHAKQEGGDSLPSSSPARTSGQQVANRGDGNVGADGGVEEKRNPMSRIRVWVDEEKKSFYDCVCGKRKPTQDLKKIIRHVEGHAVLTYPCEVCGRIFKHHLGRNSHQRVHKPNSEQ